MSEFGLGIDPLEGIVFPEEENETCIIHIRLTQRNGRKTVTSIEGIPDKYDLKKMLTKFKCKFACGGNIGLDKTEENKVLMLNGDHRSKLSEFFAAELPEFEVKIHGV